MRVIAASLSAVAKGDQKRSFVQLRSSTQHGDGIDRLSGYDFLLVFSVTLGLSGTVVELAAQVNRP